MRRIIGVIALATPPAAREQSPLTAGVGCGGTDEVGRVHAALVLSTSHRSQCSSVHQVFDATLDLTVGGTAHIDGCTDLGTNPLGTGTFVLDSPGRRDVTGRSPGPRRHTSRVPATSA